MAAPQMAAPRIADVAAEPDGLRVTWAASAGGPSLFPWLWLRDHGEDPDSLDPGTKQRRVDTFALPPDLAADAVDLAPGGDGVAIAWRPAAPRTWVSARLLARAAGVAPESHAPGLHRRLWRAGQGIAVPDSHAHDAVVETEHGLKAALAELHRLGFVLISGTPTEPAAVERLARRIGYVRETIFGGMWTLSAELTDHGDSAYSSQFLEPHTDATYSPDAPGLQMFTCMDYDAKGGDTILVDGLALAADLRAEDPEAFRVLAETPVPARYIEPGVHLRAERPALRLDRTGAVIQVSFNNYDRAPFLLDPQAMAAFYRAYGALHARIMDQANWLKIPLRPGMTLIFDNWRLLHGRMGFVGKRVFHGCYHNREDYESRMRVLFDPA